MQTKSELMIVRKRDLLDPSYVPPWQDPEGVATLPAEKRAAMLSNPLSRSDDDPVQIVGVRDGKAAGRLDLFAGACSVVRPGGGGPAPGGLAADRQTVPLLWTSNLWVPPEHRSSLLGVTLILKMQALCPTVAACAVSQQALPVYEKLRWVDFRMPRLILLRRSRAVVERYLGRGPVGRAARAVADAGLLGFRAVLRAYTALRTRGLRTQPAPRAAEDLDPLLAREGGQAAVVIHRSAAWINWLLDNALAPAPRDRQGLFYVRDRGGDPLGYFLLKAHLYPVATHRQFRDLFIGSLKDWAVFEPARLGFTDLVLLAAAELARWGVDAVEVCLPDPAAAAALRRHGFVPAGDLHLVFKAAPGTPLADPALHRQPLWNIRPADGDNFFG